MKKLNKTEQMILKKVSGGFFPLGYARTIPEKKAVDSLIAKGLVEIQTTEQESAFGLLINEYIVLK